VALIKQKLFQSGFSEAEKVMVETVERFQGSQRDIILVSFCVNRAEQMHYLCAMTREGTVDRKLNVAITRARQQLFLVGNGAILREHPSTPVYSITTATEPLFQTREFSMVKRWTTCLHGTMKVHSGVVS